MAQRYDVVVIGSGLGGLTAAALLARAGRKTILIERNHGVGGAASTYKAGDLVVEASLHKTSDPQDPIDPKHQILKKIGVLDKLEWIRAGPLYEVRGGPIGDPFILPEGFAAARTALRGRFPSARAGINSVLGEMEQLATGLGILSRGREVFRKPAEAMLAIAKLAPLVKEWRLSLSERFRRGFDGDEAVKCALAANLIYWHDDPDTLSWILFGAGQGGYLASGGRFVKGGSQRLSNAIARTFRAAGGELVLHRAVTRITMANDGRPLGVVHERRDGGDGNEVMAPIIVSNAAPGIVATMLPEPARSIFWERYEKRRLSMSLFSATFGLSRRPAELGLHAYATFLFPDWMKRLSDYKQSASLLTERPSESARPAVTIVDYSAIDSGLGGPPYPVAVVGPDKLSHWGSLEPNAYEDKRRLWRDAVIETVDRQFPGFAATIMTGVFSTASTMSTYLNAPGGAVYGFAPLPPSAPFWRGLENSPQTPITGLYLASSYAGYGGFTGAILAGSAAADCAMVTPDASDSLT
jgi:phytoene dehydrogenase-like protein